MLESTLLEGFKIKLDVLRSSFKIKYSQGKLGPGGLD